MGGDPPTPLPSSPELLGLSVGALSSVARLGDPEPVFHFAFPFMVYYLSPMLSVYLNVVLFKNGEGSWPEFFFLINHFPPLKTPELLSAMEHVSLWVPAMGLGGPPVTSQSEWQG